jgi:hypothetical protein
LNYSLFSKSASLLLKQSFYIDDYSVTC